MSRRRTLATHLQVEPARTLTETAPPIVAAEAFPDSWAVLASFATLGAASLIPTMGRPQMMERAFLLWCGLWEDQLKRWLFYCGWSMPVAVV